MDQSDIELYFKNNNLGIGVENPKNKLAIEGNIKANQYYLINGQLKNDNSKLILENNNDKILLGDDRINFNTQKIGINNVNPSDTLDINGGIKFSENLSGTNGIIMSYDNDIRFNPDYKYDDIYFRGNANFNNRIIINDNNVDIEDNSLSVKNKIYDGNGVEFVNLNNNALRINENSLKDIFINGKVHFIGSNGVNIGNDYGNASEGELDVKNKIKTSNIEIEDNPERMINFDGIQSSNVKLGKYTYFSNLNDKDQSSLLGNNLYADNDTIRIAENTTEDGYRGIAMNSTNGIQFYVNSGEAIKNYQPNMPDLTISNTGQLIYSIPVLPHDFVIENLQNEVYVYIREQLGNKKVGSSMTFTTTSYLKESKIINALKNSETTIKCFIVNKTNNYVEKHFDVSLN